jgi:hypothetical protein
MHRDAAVTTQGDGDRKHLSSNRRTTYGFLSPSRHFVVDTSSVLAKSRAPGVSAAIALEKGFNGDGAVVSYLNGKGDSHETYGNSISFCVRALQRRRTCPHSSSRVARQDLSHV